MAKATTIATTEGWDIRAGRTSWTASSVASTSAGKTTMDPIAAETGASATDVTRADTVVAMFTVALVELLEALTSSRLASIGMMAGLRILSIELLMSTLAWLIAQDRSGIATLVAIAGLAVTVAVTATATIALLLVPCAGQSCKGSGESEFLEHFSDGFDFLMKCQ